MSADTPTPSPAAVAFREALQPKINRLPEHLQRVVAESIANDAARLFSAHEKKLAEHLTQERDAALLLAEHRFEEGERLREALQRCADKFREYEELHRKKAPIGVCGESNFGDACDMSPTCANCGASRIMHEFCARALGKANANANMAVLCESALAPSVPDPEKADAALCQHVMVQPTVEDPNPICGHALPCCLHGAEPGASGEGEPSK